MDVADIGVLLRRTLQLVSGGIISRSLHDSMYVPQGESKEF
jgi:hypothetical protein